MSEAPERIWIEDEFGEGDDDQWTYGTWDVRNYAGYDIEYVRTDIVGVLTAERDQIFQLVQRAITIFENCSVSTDTCCCGDSMSSHGDAISCGHMPVDMGDYQSSLWLSEARGILKEEMK